MPFPTEPAPHSVTSRRVSGVMLSVVLSLLPLIVVQTVNFGWGLLIQIVVAVEFAYVSEIVALRLRRLPPLAYLRDGSTLTTAILLALAIPPLAPWWLAATGATFAVLLAKHAYGGLGYNSFNPAMVGYAVLLVSFPVQMSLWPLPIGIDGTHLTFWQTLQTIGLGHPPQPLGWDAITGATPLAALRSGFQLGQTIEETRASPIFGTFGGRGWEWMAMAAAAGGVFLLITNTIRWHIPGAMLGTIAVLALLMHGVDPGQYPSPTFHLTTGAVMLGAFFIATDPISAPSSPRGRLAYGAGIGLLTFWIRTWGGYPDAIAFAVLLMNLLVPVIDKHTVPRIYGHER
ncbi:MAG TPA: RnfABCDGE type electron transport complex subunit D [Steroidobacteraceae bacterium]|nr:RnfABCDGE type electron transport complex subunit D [Steroidobacteraceae bacterium]